MTANNGILLLSTNNPITLLSTNNGISLLLPRNNGVTLLTTNKGVTRAKVMESFLMKHRAAEYQFRLIPLQSLTCCSPPPQIGVAGASNFFELAVAAAISLFGFQSGAALATVVGVLIEVPVMLLVVKIVNQSKGWYERPMQHQQ